MMYLTYLSPKERSSTLMSHYNLPPPLQWSVADRSLRGQPNVLFQVRGTSRVKSIQGATLNGRSDVTMKGGP